MFGFPEEDNFTWIFRATGSSANLQQWNKSLAKGQTWFSADLYGPAGGGGGGMSGATATARGGGGGGGPGSVGHFLCPLAALPEILYLNVPRGGIGGAAAAAGGAPASSTYIGISASLVTAGYLLALANAGAGGGAGTVAIGGAAGASGGVVAATSIFLSLLGIWTSVLGNLGNAGGAVAGAVGGNAACQAAIPNGGAGGASTNTTNVNFAGGNCSPGIVNMPTISGGAAGLPGGAGLYIPRPLPLFIPGAGGGSNGAGTAGRGGDGGLAAGGGGGGGGITGGAGGNGGDGLIILRAF